MPILTNGFIIGDRSRDSFAKFVIAKLAKNNNVLVRRSFTLLPQKLRKIDYPLNFSLTSRDPCFIQLEKQA